MEEESSKFFPENYIRKKSRSLPIVECLINQEWRESGIAEITIARQHTNGNITFAPIWPIFRV